MAELSCIDFKTGKRAKAEAIETPLFMEYRRPDILNEYVIMQRRTARQGTQSTLTRAEVSGTGKKPFRQKGTGNARQGTLIGPHQRGGGIAFGPKPRKYSSSLNKSLRRKAIAVALSQRAYDKELLLIDSFEIKTGKTKDASEFLKKANVPSILVVGSFTDETWRACRNLEKLKLIEPQNLNVKDIMGYRSCILTQDAMEWLKANLEPKLGKEIAA